MWYHKHMDTYENYDLTDEQWKRVEPMLPLVRPTALFSVFFPTIRTFVDFYTSWVNTKILRISVLAQHSKNLLPEAIVPPLGETGVNGYFSWNPNNGPTLIEMGIGNNAAIEETFSKHRIYKIEIGEEL